MDYARLAKSKWESGHKELINNDLGYQPKELIFILYFRFLECLLEPGLFYIYIVLVVFRDYDTDGGRAETRKQETDELIVARFLVGKGFPKMRHHVVESIVEHGFKLQLALLVV